MKNTIILSSVTYAMKAQRLLNSAGVNCNIVKSDGVRAVKGCGYGVQIYGDINGAADILRKNGIRILGFAAYGT